MDSFQPPRPSSPASLPDDQPGSQLGYHGDEDIGETDKADPEQQQEPEEARQNSTVEQTEGVCDLYNCIGVLLKRLYCVNINKHHTCMSHLISILTSCTY